MKQSHVPCHICDGQATLETVLMVQMSGIDVIRAGGIPEDKPIPLCAAHISKAESAFRDIQASEAAIKRSPPVILKMAGVCGNSQSGN